MVWIARLLLFIPSLVAGWFVSQEDPRYWVIALAIGLTFLALGIVAAIYIPILHPWPRRKR
ncbi:MULTISPECIES: hypothetical protein [Sphingobium]|jgi:hypothetical protein|uniref:Uncharacterized protein n=1 Tax=Sphingobium yanoikuyae TaxID=13690 RepID=A0A0J9D3J8_SPHYA|nr:MULTISPECIES: hypothetical protein [Sphingobium]ATP19726.1 hypothetical protein BV87_15875 [Sphingobium yanoikuyae]KMW31918.1 hypothetical protein BV87_20690 [Sphingobium yanoikuyae]MBR2267892.1 hypothetical protein [Sphingobium sp.]TKV44661.1 hypothetical protein A0U87_00305 [Sphingobium sp. MP9-4]